MISIQYHQGWMLGTQQPSEYTIGKKITMTYNDAILWKWKITNHLPCFSYSLDISTYYTKGRFIFFISSDNSLYTMRCGIRYYAAYLLSPISWCDDNLRNFFIRKIFDECVGTHIASTHSQSYMSQMDMDDTHLLLRFWYKNNIIRPKYLRDEKGI